MTTEQFNHAPAQLLMHTGNQLLGQASLGAWATYGLGTLNRDLPGFVVLVSGGKSPDAGKSVWGSAYLPGVYQGVQCRSVGDPISVRRQSAGHEPRSPPARASMRWPTSIACRRTSSARPRRWRASSSTSWRFACRCPCRK